MAHEQNFEPATFWVSQDVLFCKFNKDVVINLETAKEMVAYRKRTFGQLHRPLFVDVDNLLSIDLPARRYLSSAYAWEYLTAGAMFTNNALLMFLGKAWLQLDKPAAPVRFFSNTGDALLWLNNYKSLT